MQLTSGTRVRRYEIVSLLGRGGMGEVYLARDVELGRSVALKVLPHFEGDPDAEERVRRFVQEARAAVTLTHPNVAHLYDAGDDGGIRFIAMEYVEGETLRQRMHRRSFTTDEALDVAIQIASALAEAHARGIVHRDIKPDNVMLRPDGYVKVLDFGLAKLTPSETHEATAPVQTQTGLIMGTVHYMSPEQLCGQPVDGRTDIFSLGVLLYELLGGRRPFEAPSPSAVIAAILTEEPAPLDNVPPDLGDVVKKTIAKKRDDRFASAGDLVTALRLARGSARVRSGDVPTQILTSKAPRRMTKRRWLYVIAAIVLIPIVWGALVLIALKRQVAHARADLPRLEKLADDRKYFEAWSLAHRMQRYFDDARLGSVLERVSTRLSVKTDPPGAFVSLQRIVPNGTVDEQRLPIGTTPLDKHAIAQGDYILTIEKDGYAPFTRTLQAQPMRHVQGSWVPTTPPRLEVTLTKRDALPPEMVAVSGGPYRLTGWQRPSDEEIALAPYFLDRFEVSNGEYERFVRDGGYRRRELWKAPFVKDGKPLSFDEAMALLHDATGLAGPRGWANGTFPAGRANHPVTGVTWHEAAAFAAWAGKRLPTVYEWDKAARNGVNSGIGRTYPWGQVTEGDVGQRANFRGVGPMPVDSLPAGMSVWGAYHLAGNVSEWLRNPNEDGFAVTGGAFDDAEYIFSFVGMYPAFYSSPKLGFRCVKSSGDQGALALATTRTEVPAFTPVGDAEFAKIRARFAYQKVSGAKVIERKETTDWIREKVTYPAADGSQDAILYLYLPKGVAKPYQVIHFAPAGDVTRGFRRLDTSMESTLVTLMRSGRAVFGVVLEGYLERESTSPAPRSSSAEAVDALVQRMADLRRGIDYIASRPDLDATRLGLLGMSAGADIGTLVTALDDRYRAVVFSGAGVRAADVRNYEMKPELLRVNFIPRIAAPKLLLHGRYDESHPFQTEGQPVFQLMRGEKRLVMYEGGHIPPPDVLFRELTAFYDQYLGKVGR